VGEPAEGVVAMTFDQIHELERQELEAEKARIGEVDARSAAIEPTQDPRTLKIVTEPIGELRSDLVGELRVAPDLPGGKRSYGKRTCLVLKAHLDTKMPSLPSEGAVQAMTRKERASIRKLAEQSREWVVALLEMIEKVDGAQ
jgi:hypothetical protein